MDDRILIDLIKENKGLICSIINKYAKYYDFDDLFQASRIGISKAYRNYKENMGVKFSTYAYKYILSEVLAYVNSFKPIKIPREYHQLYKKILETRIILTQELMKEPSNYEISLFLNIDEALINEVIGYQDKVKSLDEVITDDGKEITLMDTISSTRDNINFDSIFLKEGLKTLSNDELELIQLRYFQDKTQSEIAKILGTNQVQVSRNEQKVLKKLKNNFSQPHQNKSLVKM